MMKLKLNTINVGKILMVLYIFMSYNAKGILLPPALNSIFLYSFLGMGLLQYLSNAGGGRLIIPTYSLWYILLVGLSFINSLYSPSVSYGSGQFYLMLVTLGITFVIQVYVKDEKTFTVVMWTYVISAFVFILSLYISGNLVATRDNRLGEDLVGNANAFATMIMVSSMCCLWLLVYESKTIIARIFLILVFLLNTYALILSAGRSAFVIPFVFLYILLLLKTNSKGRKSVIKYSIISFIVIFIAWYLIMNVPLFYDNIGYRFEMYYNGVRGISSIGNSAYVRNLLRKEAFEKTFESPIWGHGFDSFRYYSNSLLGISYYSHCNFTELLYNGGIIMFVAYYWVYYKIVKLCVEKNNGLHKYRSFSLALVIAMLVIDLTGVTYASTLEQIMLALGMTCLSFDHQSVREYEIEGA
jgi:O-antigen ligase